MSLMVSRDANIEIPVNYEVMPDSTIKYHEEVVPGNTNIKSERFFFRKPSWADSRNIMIAASRMDPNGSLVLDPFKFIDIRIKTLLGDWTLVDEKDKKMLVTAENIDRLHPSLLSYLSDKLDALDKAK